MNLSRLWTITRLELTQRIRTVSWYVLLGIFAVLMVGVTAFAFLSYGSEEDRGAGVYSTVVYITLLLAVLVSPTLSGNSINGDRDAATLAPVQVTLASTGEILFGKFLAAWITGLAFAAVAAPFLIIATLAGGVSAAMVLVSVAILVAQIGIIAAIGVAISGILPRPLFSVAATYLVVAALTVGTPIAFGLVGASIKSEVTQTSRYVESCADGTEDCWGGEEPQPGEWVCSEWETYTWEQPRFDRVWWMLAPNPFVILADATPVSFDRHGGTVDLFGAIKHGVRSAQLAPETEATWDECARDYMYGQGATAEEVIAETVPSWFVGLGLQVLLAGGLMWWAWARTRTPARTLPTGTRIA